MKRMDAKRGMLLVGIEQPERLADSPPVRSREVLGSKGLKKGVSEVEGVKRL